MKFFPRNPAIARLTLEVFHELQQRITDEVYPCLGAQAAFRQETYRFGVYPDMGTAEATAGLAHDLFTFLQEQDRIDSGYATFIAVFAGPASISEADFEEDLWRQLDSLHALDREHHGWSSNASSDPEDPHFAYSFAETALFIIGMHRNSSRVARRFPYPALVFNTHEQFDRLRREGIFEPLRAAIRERDRVLNGSINPMLDDFGVQSEARQYSGRAVNDTWTCPFHPRKSAARPHAISGGRS